MTGRVTRGENGRATNATGGARPVGVQPGPVRPAGGGVTVAVRLTPKASANRIEGVAAAADGSAVLRARVTAAPESGKANAALIKMLAKTWNLPKSSLTIAGGAKDRRKLVHVAGETAALTARLEGWVGAHDG